MPLTLFERQVSSHIHDQIEIEEHACHRPRHPRDVPGPDLTWRTGLIAGRWFTPDRGLGSATVMLLTIRAQDAVEAGLGCQIQPLIGQLRHDLAWWQTAKFL